VTTRPDTEDWNTSDATEDQEEHLQRKQLHEQQAIDTSGELRRTPYMTCDDATGNGSYIQ
jgi:hypothetical protein